MSEQAKSKRRLWQLHLSTLLTFTLLVAALMWANAMPYRTSRGFDAYGFPKTMVYVPTQEAENGLFKDYVLPEKWFPHVNGYPWRAEPDCARFNAWVAVLVLISGTILAECLARLKSYLPCLSRKTIAALIFALTIVFWANVNPLERTREVKPGESFLWNERGWPFAYYRVHDSEQSNFLLVLDVLIGTTALTSLAYVVEVAVNPEARRLRSVSFGKWVTFKCHCVTILLIIAAIILFIWLDSRPHIFTYMLTVSSNSGPWHEEEYFGIARGWPMPFLSRENEYGFTDIVAVRAFLVDIFVGIASLLLVYCVSEIIARRRETGR